MEQRKNRLNNAESTGDSLNSAIRNSRKPLEHWHFVSLWLIVYDIFVTNGAYFIALWLRFDCNFSEIPGEYLGAFLRFAPFYSVFVFFTFLVLHLYQSIWRFASYREFERVVIGTAITTVFHIVGISVFFQMMPISYYICGPVLQFGMVLIIRFAYRFVLLERSRILDLQPMMTHRTLCLSAREEQVK